jgi:hypothetical protein
MKMIILTGTDFENGVEMMKTALSLLAKVHSVETPTFVRIENYQNEKTREIANHTINIGIDYGASRERDTVKLLDATTSNPLQEQARRELLDSKQLVTVDAQKRSQVQKDTYTHIGKNIKFHNKTLRLYICGQSIKKDVILPGVYTTVSSAKTLEKKKLEKDLKTFQFRQFCFDKINFIKIHGTEFILG